MKRFKIISILLLLVIFTMILFGSSSFAQETIDKIIKRGTIRVGFCADVPPLKFRDKNGEPAGLCVEWSEALARDLGVELEYVFTDWAGLIPALLSDRSDIIIADVSITLERAKKINYSIPWMDSGMYMAVKKDSEWESWEDMNREDVTIGVNLGGLAELVVPRFFPKAKRSVYNSIAELRIALEQGRIDGYSNDLIFILQDVRMSNEKFRLLPEVIFEAPFAFAVRSDDQHWLNWVNLWINEVRASGEYDKMMDYWVFTNEWQKDYPEF